MTTIKVGELSGKALDYAVALCEGLSIGAALVSLTYQGESMSGPFSPSTNWAQGGPIVERERISILDNFGAFYAYKSIGKTVCVRFEGGTILITAMRCYVASKLGDAVEIPDELLKA